MSSKAARREGPSALDWLETAVWLIRSVPKGALLCYYTGSVVCVLGLVYFWADMSQGAFARDHMIESSLTAAAFYIWMKCWQAVFLSKVRAHLLMEPEALWSVRRAVNLVFVQAALQPVGLCLRLIAAQILIPYIWTYSLFMGVAILGDGTRPSLREVLVGGFREAGLWWPQTHLSMIALFGFAFFIWGNVFLVCAALPHMLQMFGGIETPFTRSGWGMINTTFFAATFAITYLCFDPLRKAVFLVRHFQAASRTTGEDLRVELKAIRSGLRTMVAAVVLLGMFLSLPGASLRAEEPTAPRVESTQLDDSLNRVLEKRQYAWRLPRVATENVHQKGWIAAFFEGVGKTIMGWYKSIGKLMERLGKWLRSLLDRKPREPSTSSSASLNWGGVARGTLIALAVGLVVVVGVLLWRSRRKIREMVMAHPVAAVVPDLNEESVTADQLPEDGWLQMARELMERGEMRLALRAFYLAGLAHLGQRELIRIARHKSNRDYDVELRRRARGNADLLSAFDANLLVFEASWYGEHAVTREALGGFSQNLERIRAC